MGAQRWPIDIVLSIQIVHCVALTMFYLGSPHFHHFPVLIWLSHTCSAHPHSQLSHQLTPVYRNLDFYVSYKL
ncbi:hypothetical protein BDZ94DRAFT_480940 [Collybia nuda]|uniref:Uncharacterized protein n=1 Tax=Collybia nuda TaxID=64659 RepID=A0A9P5Y6V0_9AGAR|nr:hypothetical protein BDZ94DRAFT_480940 [Collybia nuda]